jgi:hypothetical protein
MLDLRLSSQVLYHCATNVGQNLGEKILGHFLSVLLGEWI